MTPGRATGATGLPSEPPSTALLTDHYELTMLDAALHSGVADHRAVFQLWARSLPKGRRYGVVGGTGRALEGIGRFRFGAEELDHLATHRVVGDDALDWLAGFRFAGDVDGYAEGEVYVPGSPVLTVEGTFAEAMVLETLLLSILNHDSAIASAAARMAEAARGRALIEMGTRRTHEQSAVAAARAAYLAGFDSTSNLEAGRRHGVPTGGTVAHAFVMAHADEQAAFEAQIATQGVGTTILVDTYDVPEGIRRAVRAAQRFGAPGPGAIRIDAGDLLVGTREARALLDDLGAAGTRIVVSGDLDEYRIDELERAPGGRAPIDAYGVGTRVATGSGHPTVAFIYKLVAVADAPGPDAPLRPVHKEQAGKATRGGRKLAHRLIDARGRAVGEVLHAGPDAAGRAARMALPAGARLRPLQVPLIRAGQPLPQPSLQESRELHVRSRAELPEEALALEPGEPVMHAELVGPED